MRTDGNDKCFHQLESLPTDPDNIEDALKSNADIFGQGGDDFYDETRYAVASRVPPSPSRFLETKFEAWSPNILALEADRQRQSKMPRSLTKRRMLHPEFGEIM